MTVFLANLHLFYLPLPENTTDTMKTTHFNFILSFAVVTALSFSAQAQNKVIYTGEIAKKVVGYNGPTPLNITISGGKITKIDVLDNEESPRYLDKAKAKVLPQYIGKTVKQALNLKADIATGATYTSKALIENIQLGLQQASAGTKSVKKSAQKATKVKKAKKAKKKRAKKGVK